MISGGVTVGTQASKLFWRRRRGLLSTVALVMLIALAGTGEVRAQECKSRKIENWIENLDAGGEAEKRSRIELSDCSTAAIAPLRKTLASNDWQSSPQQWALHKALLEVLTGIARDLDSSAPTLEEEELKPAATELGEALKTLESFETEFQQTPPPGSGQAFDTPEERATYAATVIADLRTPLKQLRLWLVLRQYGLWLGGGAIAVIAVLGYGSVLWLKPLWLLGLPAKFKIPKTEIELSVGMMRWLKYRPRVLDRWVAVRLAKARTEFKQKDTVREREVHIPIPAKLDGELVAEPGGGDLREIFETNRFCLLIVGEGGSGKTSLACQIAWWAMADEAEERPCKHRLLPVLIEQELTEVEEGKEPLLEAIRGQLNNLIDAEFPVATELVEQLLRQRRLLVIIDHLSEMTQATRENVRPQQPGFPVNALIVTSRLSQELEGVTKTRLEPLRVEGDRLIPFIYGYLERLEKRNLFEDEDYTNACDRLRRLVGQRSITVLLAKLYIDQMIEQQQGAGGTLPASVPELMLSYLNQLNRNIESANRRDDLQVQRDAQRVAWECLKQTYRPTTAKKEDALQTLAAPGTQNNAQARLDYLEKRLRLLQTLEPGDKLRIILDPLAEYLAALCLVDYCSGKPEERWQEFLNSIDPVLTSTNDPPEAIQGFLLAVRDSSLLKRKEARVPDWVPEELARKAGLDPAELRRIEERRRIRLLISDLSAPELEYRLRAAEDLGERGVAAAMAVPNLLGMVENPNQTIEARQAAAEALGKLGASSDSRRDDIAEHLIVLLDNDSDEPRLRRSVAEVLGEMQAGKANLLRILENDSQPLPVRQGAARAISQIGAPSGESVPMLTVQLIDGQKTSTQVQSIRILKESLPEGLTLALVGIPGGEFLMGSPPDEKKRYAETQHWVKVKPFQMSQYQITQAQWRAVATLPQVERSLEPEPANFKGNDRPVENVSWWEAVEFCNRLSQYTGKTYRLPSEAEWEYACRARTVTPFHFGETLSTELANYNGNYIYGEGNQGVYRQETTEVGSFGVVNAFGLSDMHGNVWEWCEDHWHKTYKGTPTDGSAWLTENQETYRLLRGGSWYDLPWDCRSALRLNNLPELRNGNIGFRVVCDAPRA